MQETLYRRGADGFMETVVPEAQGKAAALSAYLARGGTPFKHSGRFKTGPMKGKTVDQATAEFERMWAASPDALKQKYANRTSGRRTDLAPSERTVPGSTPVQPKDMSAAGMQKRRMASYGHEFDSNGVAVPINRPKTVVKPVRKTTPAPGSDEARAAALTANSQNERFATADTGDGGMAAAIAMDKYQGRPVSAPVEKTPIEGAIDSAVAANTRFWDRTTNAVNSAVAAPFTPASERIVGAESEAARRTLEAKRAADAAAEQNRLTAENAAKLRREKGLPDPSPTTAPTSQAPAPAIANQPPTPVAVPRTSVTPAMQPTPTGAPVMGDAPRGVNRLTGLPMGHLPGDSLPQKFAGDRQMQGRAADSLVRQQFAEPITAGAPRAVPVLTPTAKPPGFEQRAADEMRRQAAINRNPSTVNPDDPKKFFTGRTLPLDQLVDPSKRPGSGYQVGGVGPSGGRVLSIRPARR